MTQANTIPGASRVTSTDHMTGEEVQTKDHKGRPLWNMPKPKTGARHFVSAHTKRLFHAGEMTLNEATHVVPVYAGMDIRVLRTLREEIRREKVLREHRRPKSGGLNHLISDMLGA